jgi:spore maturation protein CgeB
VRVGIIGPAGPDDFADNIASALNSMGHEPVNLGIPYPRSRGRLAAGAVDVLRKAGPLDSAFHSRVVRRARETKPDLIVNVLGRFETGALAKIRSSCGVMALWFPDSVTNLGRQLMFQAPYDALFFKEPVLVDRVRKMLGLPAHYLPEACNPAWHRPPEETVEELSRVIVVAGSSYPWRVRLLERMVDAGLPIRIFGPTPPRWLDSEVVRRYHTGHYLRCEEKAVVFRSAGAVLNNLHPTEIDGVNCRLFEAAGCGAAVLTETRPQLSELFEPEHEVLVFSNFDELVDSARVLLSSREIGKKVGDAAALRAHRDHTYQHRIAEILRVLELS